MKITDLFEAKRKLTASMKKQIASLKKSDAIWPDLLRQNIRDELSDEVYEELREWSYALERQYEKLQKDVEIIEEKTKSYLFDFNVDEENALENGRTRDSVDYWDSMLDHAHAAIGQRAEEYGIDINAELGYKIY